MPCSRRGCRRPRSSCSRARSPRVPTKVIADVHGDWRAPTRLYGSRARRLLDPLADALARVGLRRADGVRTISALHERARPRGRPRARRRVPGLHGSRAVPRPAPAPLPETPTALFVGVLERYKAIDVLAEAWPTVRRARPGRAAARRRLRLADRAPAGERDRVEPTVCRQPRSPRRSTRRRCSSFPRARRAWAVSSSRRSAAAAESSAPASAGSPTSSPTARTASSSSRAMPRARRRARPRARGPRSSPSRLGQAAQGRAGTWAATPQEFARARCGTLVERVTRLPA